MKNEMMKHNQQGFTLIELMIVVAIIGILAAIALPAYQDYTARSQAAEALTLTGGLRVDIAEKTSLGASMPSPGSLSGKYVDSVSVSSTSGSEGDITVTFKSTGVATGLVSKQMLLEYDSTVNNWTCKPGSSSGIDEKYLPSGCKAN